MNKLDLLASYFDYDDIIDALEEWAFDSVTPGICRNDDCDFIADVEPDCRNGYCDSCDTYTVVSGLVLAALI